MVLSFSILSFLAKLSVYNIAYSLPAPLTTKCNFHFLFHVSSLAAATYQVVAHASNSGDPFAVQRVTQDLQLTAFNLNRKSHTLHILLLLSNDES